MPDESDPPRKFYRLKPASSFETVNPPAGAPQPNAPIDVRELFRQANAGKAGRPAAAPADRPAQKENDVHELLRTNLVSESRAGLHEVAPKPRQPSRRKRDYVLVLMLGNLTLVAAAVRGGLNVGVVVYAFSGVVLFTVGLTWVMWFVMDDY